MENEELNINLTVPLPALIFDTLTKCSIEMTKATKTLQTPESISLGLIVAGLIKSGYLTKKDIRKCGITLL